MSTPLQEAVQTAGVLRDVIAEAIAQGNIEECVTTDGRRFFLFSRGPLDAAKAALRADIVRDASRPLVSCHIKLTPT